MTAVRSRRPQRPGDVLEDDAGDAASQEQGDDGAEGQPQHHAQAARREPEGQRHEDDGEDHERDGDHVEGTHRRLDGGEAVRLHERDGADVIGQFPPQQALQAGYAIGVRLEAGEVRDLPSRDEAGVLEAHQHTFESGKTLRVMAPSSDVSASLSPPRMTFIAAS